jgi:hypothetical protein
MDGTAVVDRGDLSDLQLSPEEKGEEAADRERGLGGSPEAIEEARQRALAEAQQALDDEDRKAQELRQEAGEPVGNMPPGDPEDVTVPPDKLMVSGTAQGSKRRWNGKAPGSVVLKLKVADIEVAEGEFKKGDRIRFEGEAVIVSEGVKDKLDKDTKTPVEAVQEHAAVVLDFELRDE